MEKYFVIGGAGFIGSRFVERLLETKRASAVTIYDNFSSGKEWHLEGVRGRTELRVVENDVKNLEALASAMEGHDVVIHLASNPDIAAAVTDPDIDYREGTLLTRNVVEAMRLSRVRNILYASGSGIYGDRREAIVSEDDGACIPISTYGASKLAGEALIASYCYMFDMTGYAFRFGNVVGPRQTHGVGYDFLRRLRRDSSKLDILGDGRQTKPYIHVDDVFAAVMTIKEKETNRCFRPFNVATPDTISVREIADLAAEVAGIAPGHVEYRFAGGDRGWKGDVPVVRLSSERVKSLGWKCERNSREAVRSALVAMWNDVCSGRIA